MASRIRLLCLLVLCLTVTNIECRRGGGSRSHGHSSHHWGGSSSGHRWGSSSSGHHWGSSSSSSHSYPSSSGFSGLGSHGSHSYPSSSSGLSGYGSSGSTWHFGSHRSSSSGLSGSGSSYRPTSSYHYYHTSVPYSLPTYYSTPQYVYIHDYRRSNSRYGDLLTGLSLYNLGRSHNHYHDHYYYDDYYRHRYDMPSDGSSSNTPQNRPQDEANCVLKVKENGREEALKIPCEIVSTFTQDSKKEAPIQPSQVNKTECTTTITKKIVPVTTTTTESPSTTTKPKNLLPSIYDPDFSKLSLNEMMAVIDSLDKMTIGIDGSLIMPTVSTRPPIMPMFDNLMPTETVRSSATVPPTTDKTTVTTDTLSSENGTVSYITKTVTTNATMVNVTVCTTNSTYVDPLSAKGSPVDASNIECAVEIQTKDASLRTAVDCKTLITYAKLPEPKPDTGILPPRPKLKSWLDNPPWWMSLFIAV